jgi:hypothetical protein
VDIGWTPLGSSYLEDPVGLQRRRGTPYGGALATSGYNCCCGVSHCAGRFAACCCAPQNIASQLRELAELKNAGALSEREYTAAKERVLGGDGQQLKDGYLALLVSALFKFGLLGFYMHCCYTGTGVYAF